MKIETRTIGTLQQFYSLMSQTREVRCDAVEQYLEHGSVDRVHIDSLGSALSSLEAIPQSEQGYLLGLDEQRTIAVDTGYETEELKKDILFLSRGEEAFKTYLQELHPTLAEQAEQGVGMLKDVKLRNLVSDRDGTTNNYCGRYLSSIQSVYNAVYIARFAQKCVRNALLLTSAPLEKVGLVEMSTIPPKTVCYAGSKGREYRDLDFKRGTFAIEASQQKKLDQLNDRLESMLREPAYEKFGLIGSGLQKKFGQTTMARQDVTGSIPREQSETFLKTLKELVEELDPGGEFFRIEDTGLDVEIILTVPSGGAEKDEEGLTDFNKGNGVAFLNQALGLNLRQGPNLVCGDTGSDLPMIEECLRQSDETWTIFVTRKNELKDRVTALISRALIVDEPDTLVTIFNRLAALR